MWLKTLMSFALIFVAVAPAISRQVAPRDECSNDPSFGPFYRNFKDIVARRNAAALIAAIPAKNANMDLGGSDRSEFVKVWKLADVNSPLWRELSATLALGCSREGKEFVSPYFFQHTPYHKGDDVGDTGITRAHVKLHVTRSATSRVKAVLNWEAVRLSDFSTSGDDFVKVRTENGREGYVVTSQVLTGYDYRAVFTKLHGRWMFTFFGNGD